MSANETNKSPTNENWVYMLKAVDKIKSEYLKDFIKGYLVDEAPDYFAKIPASATGKYHPAFSLGYGGLIRHSIAAAIIGWEICNIEYLKASSVDRDIIYAALLIHDTFKQGDTESGNTVRLHPELAAKHIIDYAKKVDFDARTANILARLVVSHMGEWGNHKPGNRMQYLVHQADYIVSRRFINLDWKGWIDSEH